MPIYDMTDSAFEATAKKHFVSQWDFDALYQQFVDGGGLDITIVVNEDWERSYKQSLCPHQRPWKTCSDCYRAPKPYWPHKDDL